MLNLGSAVIMPEVFLKALTIARNLGDGKPQNFTSVDLDMQRHYRPRMNVVQRPTLHSGKGYEITGHHEIMVPLLVVGGGGRAGCSERRAAESPAEKHEEVRPLAVPRRRDARFAACAPQRISTSSRSTSASSLRAVSGLKILITR